MKSIFKENVAPNSYLISHDAWKEVFLLPFPLSIDESKHTCSEPVSYLLFIS